MKKIIVTKENIKEIGQKFIWLFSHPVRVDNDFVKSPKEMFKHKTFNKYYLSPIAYYPNGIVDASLIKDDNNIRCEINTYKVQTFNILEGDIVYFNNHIVYLMNRLNNTNDFFECYRMTICSINDVYKYIRCTLNTRAGDFDGDLLGLYRMSEPLYKYKPYINKKFKLKIPSTPYSDNERLGWCKTLGINRK